MELSAPTWLRRSHQINPGPPQQFLLLTQMLSSFILTNKMKFSYNRVVVSNSRSLDEPGDLNSHYGQCFSSTLLFCHQLAQITPGLQKLIFPEVGKIGITFLVVRLFLWRLLLIKLLLAPLNFVLARTKLQKFFFTCKNIWRWSIALYRISIPGISCILLMFSMLVVLQHWGCSSLCLCFGPAPGQRCAASHCPLHGDWTAAQALRHGGGTVLIRDIRIIECPNRKRETFGSLQRDLWK